MSDTAAGLRRKIGSAVELQSVVRTMKALAASSIGQYERSVAALAAYDRVVELGLGVCFRQGEQPRELETEEREEGAGALLGAVIFGSDQGLVGQFNDVVADHAIATLSSLRGRPQVWAVGERVEARLVDAGLPPIGVFAVPSSTKAISPLIGKIQMETETHRAEHGYARMYVFHNRPQAGPVYEPVGRRLLPLDAKWVEGLASLRWPTRNVPEILFGRLPTLRSLVHEYLFISLFRACAESLASENASRLAAMERADQNIDDLLENLRGALQRLRQSGIDEELFDAVAGFEALSETPR